MANNTDIFGIDTLVSQTGVIGEYRTSAEIRVRFVIENANSGNTFSVYGRIKGQSNWNLIDTLVGNAIKNLTVAEFDFILVTCDAYATTGLNVHLLASGIAQSSTGISSIDVNGTLLTGLDTISLTSVDNSISYSSNTSTGVIDLSVASAAGVSQLQTLSGVAPLATNLGTFTGVIIPDNSTNKVAIQALETAIANLPDPMEYKGLWSAATNTPTLTVGTGNNGDVYQVTANGSVNFGNGAIVFTAGDKCVYNGAIARYEKWNMTDAVSSVNGYTGAVTLVKGDIGLGNIDNTSDANKPVSTAQQTALNLKANLASPALTGTPTAPTASPSNNSTQVATTAYVDAAASAVVAPNATNATKGIIKLAGELSGSADVPTLANDAVIAKTLTGYTPSTGTITSADSIISSIEKLDANIPTVLDALSDVTIASPAVNDRLTYNGIEWVNSPITSTGVGAGVVFYPDDTTVIDTYGGLLINPAIGTTTTNSIVVPAGTTVFGKGYIYDKTVDNIVLPGGSWEFHFYCNTNNASGTSQLGFDVHRIIAQTATITVTGTGTSRTCTASSSIFVSGDANANQRLASYVQTNIGTFQITAFTSGTSVTIATLSGYTNETAVACTKHSLLFGTQSVNISSTATVLIETKVVQPSFTVLPSDKIGLRVYGIASANRTLQFFINGTATYSHMVTTLVGSHNDLAGLQGGTSTERYHLTAAQAIIATQAASPSLAGYLTSTDWNTFNGKANVVAGDIVPTSFSAANNQSAVANVTGFAFASGVTRAFDAEVSVTIIATTNKYETFHILGIQKNGSFDISIEGLGDNSGVVFSITSAGQIQYTSLNSAGFVSNTIKFRSRNVGV